MAIMLIQRIVSFQGKESRIETLVYEATSQELGTGSLIVMIAVVSHGRSHHSLGSSHLLDDNITSTNPINPIIMSGERTLPRHRELDALCPEAVDADTLPSFPNQHSFQIVDWDSPLYIYCTNCNSQPFFALLFSHETEASPKYVNTIPLVLPVLADGSFDSRQSRFNSATVQYSSLFPATSIKFNRINKQTYKIQKGTNEEEQNTLASCISAVYIVLLFSLLRNVHYTCYGRRHLSIVYTITIQCLLMLVPINGELCQTSIDSGSVVKVTADGFSGDVPFVDFYVGLDIALRFKPQMNKNNIWRACRNDAWNDWCCSTIAGGWYLSPKTDPQDIEFTLTASTFQVSYFDTRRSGYDFSRTNCNGGIVTKVAVANMINPDIFINGPSCLYGTSNPTLPPTTTQPTPQPTECLAEVKQEMDVGTLTNWLQLTDTETPAQGCDYGVCDYSNSDYTDLCVHNVADLGRSATYCCPSASPVTAQPTCASIEYAWNCFGGIGGYPYQFDDNNVIIRGNDARSTVLNYLGDESVWVTCSWKKCWIGLEDLTLASNRND
eukprot:970040_1